MQHQGTVMLETPRLILRRFVPEDLEPMFVHCWSDPKVWKWTNYAPMHGIHDVMFRANMFTQRWLDAYTDPMRYSWAIHSKADGYAIGRIFARNPDNHGIELTYELAAAWWNQGLMTEGAHTVIDFLLHDVGLHRVYAWHADENPASGRVMQKCGMHQTGVVPGGCTCNAGIFNRVDYEILA